MNEQKTSIITLDEALEIETKVRVLKGKEDKPTSIFNNPVVQLFGCIFAIVLVLGCLKFVNNLESNSSNTNNVIINNN